MYSTRTIMTQRHGIIHNRRALQESPACVITQKLNESATLPALAINLIPCAKESLCALWQAGLSGCVLARIGSQGPQYFWNWARLSWQLQTGCSTWIDYWLYETKTDGYL